MKKKILKDFILTEISGVDRPAQPTAKATIMKRAGFDPLEVILKFLEEPVSFKESLDNFKGNERLNEVREELNPLFWALQDSITSLYRDLTLSEDIRQEKIKQYVSDFLYSVSEISSDLEEELIKELAGSSGEQHNPDEVTMSEDMTKKVAELEKSLSETKAELDKAYKDMAEMKAMEEKKKKMDEMKKNDETIEVSGQKISKSVVGDEQFAVLKALGDEIKKARDEAETAKLEKRAAEDFKHLPGTVAEVAKMLKAIGSMEPEVAKSFEAVLKSVEEKNSEAFKTVGKSSRGNEEVAKSFDEKISDIQKRDKVSKSRAMEIAAQEYPELVGAI